MGESADSDVRAENLRFLGSTSTFVVVDTGRRLGEVTLQIPGRHYVLDALAALACGLRLGFPFADLARGLSAFSGTRRRMELKGQVGGVRVYDSYAHHPNEIVGDLQAARSLAGEGRVVVAFQPHMVSRTRIFGHDMGVALGAADDVVVMDIYVAREDPEPGVTGALVADAVPLDPDHVVFEPSWSAVAGHLVERARPGDVVLTLGAGDVTLLGTRGARAARRARCTRCRCVTASAGRRPRLRSPLRARHRPRPAPTRRPCGSPARTSGAGATPAVGAASAWSCSRCCWWPPCRPRCGWCSSPAT